MARWWTWALVAWPVLVVPGFALVEAHAVTAGRQAAAPATWPGDAGVPRRGDRPSLVMLAHPKCPCTRASLRELERLMAAAGGRLEATVLFLDPGTGEAWTSGGSWDLARAIPGVAVLPDADGALAHRLGALTSGQVVVYDVDGARVFQGGLTPARGHEGRTDGQARILDGVLHGFDAGPGTADVFGCPLTDEGPP